MMFQPIAMTANRRPCATISGLSDNDIYTCSELYIPQVNTLLIDSSTADEADKGHQKV